MTEQGLKSTPSSSYQLLASLTSLPPGSRVFLSLASGLSPPTLQFQPRDPPGGVLLRREGAMELNDVEFPLKDAVAKGDLRREKQRRQ